MLAGIAVLGVATSALGASHAGPFSRDATAAGETQQLQAATRSAPAGTLPGDTAVPFWPHETGALVGTSETFVDVRFDGSYFDPSVGRRVFVSSAASGRAYAGPFSGDETAAGAATVPARLYGTYDDIESGKNLRMDLLRAGHRFCVRFVKTTGPCSRTYLAGGLIGTRVVGVGGDRLALPERYRTPNLGSLCLNFVPVYGIPKAGARLTLRVVGFRTSAGRPVSPAAVQAADCLPPRIWQHRLEEQQLQAARKAVEGLRTLERAQAAGYVEASPCIPGEGVHYGKQALAQDSVVRPDQPELLLFAPGAGGRPALVAVEYWKADADGDKKTAADRPTLFGHAFDGPMDGHAPNMPVHYDLHVWIGADNPTGMFTAPNPTIRCPSQP